MSLFFYGGLLKISIIKSWLTYFCKGSEAVTLILYNPIYLIFRFLVFAENSKISLTNTIQLGSSTSSSFSKLIKFAW